MTTFDKLTAPLKEFIDIEGTKIDRKSGSKSLFFGDFTLKMIYAILNQIPSLRLLVTDLATNTKAANLGLSPSPYSTLRDGFSRFAVVHFRNAFFHILKSYSWMRMEGMDEIGMIKLVDGSLFPTLISMNWASYKKTKNAIRLHLELELNTLLPTEFLVQKGNSNERSFLCSILKKGCTYIADRGYFSFKVGKAIEKAQAYFIMRIKSNLLHRVEQELEKKGSLPICFTQVRDQLITFTNDDFGLTYRVVSFHVLESHFLICTNRFELTTLQIIMLYAYRWQIELLFKFIKRTLKGLHLFNHSEEGAKIHFYLFMILAILQLRLKQICQKKTQKIMEQKRTLEELNTYFGVQPQKWIKEIAKDFYQHWKVSLHWIKCLSNFIDQQFSEIIAVKLASQ